MTPPANPTPIWNSPPSPAPPRPLPHLQELEALTGSATASLRRYLAASLDRMERALPPRFIWHVSRPDHVRQAIIACGGGGELAEGDDPEGGSRLGTPAGGAGRGGGGASAPGSPGAGGQLTPGAGQVVVAGAAAAVSGLPSLVLAMEGVAFDTNFDYQVRRRGERLGKGSGTEAGRRRRRAGGAGDVGCAGQWMHALTA